MPKVDTNEVRKRAEQYFKQATYGRRSIEERYLWTDTDRILWKDSYSRAYNEVKKEHSQKAAILWTKIMDSGNLKKLFNSYGFVLHDGKVSAYDAGSVIIRAVLDQVIKDIEKDIGLTGLKIKKRVTALTTDLIDWSEVRPVEENEGSNKEEIETENTSE